MGEQDSMQHHRLSEAMITLHSRLEAALVKYEAHHRPGSNATFARAYIPILYDDSCGCVYSAGVYVDHNH